MGALLTFYRAPFSRYEGDLMKEWHARGHAVSIEVDLTSITQYAVQENGKQVRYGRTPEDLNENHLSALRANLQKSWDVFRRETGLDVEDHLQPRLSVERQSAAGNYVGFWLVYAHTLRLP